MKSVKLNPYKDNLYRKGFHITSIYSSSRLWGFILSIALSVMMSPVFANPEGGHVSAGQAVISSPDANTIQINQTSNKAIIDW